VQEKGKPHCFGVIMEQKVGKTSMSRRILAGDCQGQAVYSTDDLGCLDVTIE